MYRLYISLRNKKLPTLCYISSLLEECGQASPYTVHLNHHNLVGFPLPKNSGTG